MGMKVNAAQAAQLVDRNERRIRAWIHVGLGDWKLPATKAGNTWLIDIDDLAAAPVGVTLDRELLARLQAEQGNAPGGLLSRVEALEAEIQQLRIRLRALEHQ